MAIIEVTETTSGAPGIWGAAGRLVALFDFALPLNGWSIEYTSGNARIYRMGAGSKRRLYVDDGGVVSGNVLGATVRMCEDASGASSPIDIVPLTTQLTNTTCIIEKSSLANTTARNFSLYVGTTFIHLFVNITSSTNVWDFFSFGDAIPVFSGDPYCTYILLRAITANTSPGNAWQTTNAYAAAGTAQFLCRDRSGALRSSHCEIRGRGATLGIVAASGTPALGGPTGKIDLNRCVIVDNGGSATGNTVYPTRTVIERCVIPNLWNPVHSGRGTINSRDNFQDNHYNASADFIVFTSGSAGATVAVERTDTFQPWST